MDFSKLGMTPPHLKQAMKLMQSGDLQAATAAIQNNLNGTTAPATPNPKNPIRDVTPNAPATRPKLEDNLTSTKGFAKTDESTSSNDSTNSDESPSKPSNKLQDFAEKIKHFKLDLPSSINLGGLSGLGSIGGLGSMGAGLKTHSEPLIPDNAQFLKGTLSASQGSHSYRLYIPSNYEQAVAKGSNLPLIVMLHGCTQSPEDFATGTRMNELAEEHQCLIVYPSQPSSANQNRCWNWFRPSDQQQGQGEPAWLAALTQSIIKDYAVDAAKVYIAGLSAGAAMAVIMAETYPEMFAAVGVHSGLAYRSATDLSSAMMAMQKGGAADAKNAKNNKFVPTIVFHGDQDHTVSIRNGGQIFEQAQERLHAQQTDLSTQQHKQVSEQNQRSTQLEIVDSKGVSQLEYWKIHGAGHSWAGGSSAGSYTDPNGPDASKEMLRFFLTH